MLANDRALAVALAMALLACRGPEPGHRAGDGERVISLHDVTTEIVIELGAAKRLVGVAEAESVLWGEPDVVLGIEIVRQKSPELVSDLERRNKGVYFPALATLDDVEAMIREVGRRLGVAEAGDALAARLADEVGREG